MEHYLVISTILSFFLIRTNWINVTLEDFKNFMKMNDSGKSHNTNYHLDTDSVREFLQSMLGAAVEFLTPRQYTYTHCMCFPSSPLPATAIWDNHRTPEFCPVWDE